VGPRAGLDAVVKTKIPSQIIQSVAQHYTAELSQLLKFLE